MSNYVKPQIAVADGPEDAMVDVIWLVFFIPAWIAALYYGGSWAWCQATCGWGRVASCTQAYGSLKAVCRR